MRRICAQSTSILRRHSVCCCLLFCALLFACGFSFPLYESPHLTATLASDAEHLSYETPLIATLTVTARPQDEVQLPNLNERFQGFTLVEAFEAARQQQDNQVTTLWRLRLTPAGEGPWRLLPFIFTVRDTHTGNVDELLTAAINFPEPPPLPIASGAPECQLEPEWIAPELKTILFWVLIILGSGGLILLLLPWLRCLKRKLKERTLSPEERARLELNRLIAEGLPEKGLVKEFYFGLTGVVRRYFERQYGIRATRQTTQEFLNHLLREVPLGADERSALADFLAAADRVKFAGISVSAAEAADATNHARKTIEVDAAQHAWMSP